MSNWVMFVCLVCAGGIISSAYLERTAADPIPIVTTQATEGLLLTCYDAEDEMQIQNFAFRSLVEDGAKSYAVGTDGYEQEITGLDCEIDIE